MTQTVQYVALKPLSLTVRGERLRLAPGDVVPVEAWGGWLTASVGAGTLIATPSLDLFTDAELKDELAARGYKVTKPTAKAA